MPQDLHELVANFVHLIEQFPFDSDDEWDSDLDEDAYMSEQQGYCSRLPGSTGNLVYNALVFFAHGASEGGFTADWMRQHTDGKFVFISMGKGYFAVMISTLAATLKTLDRITCQTHPFYRETGRQNRILNEPSFADRVRPWHPVWCANDLFVRFATTDDGIMEYSVVYSDYSDASAPSTAAGHVAFKPAVYYGAPGETAAPPAKAGAEGRPAAADGGAGAAQTVAQEQPPGEYVRSVKTSVGNKAAAQTFSKWKAANQEENGEGGETQAKKKAKKQKAMTPQEKENARRRLEASKGLPPGWKAFVDASGNLYYGNASTGAASWTRPTQ